MAKRLLISTPHMGENEIKYVNQAFETNWVAPLGPLVNEFEKRLYTYCGTKYAVALSSGTAAIHLGLLQLGAGKGDLVICQSNTFSGSANPIVYTGAEPVFIDSEADTWNMDPEALAIALADLDAKGDLPRVKAILPVHLYGMPARMQEIAALANQYGIPIIEDAAEALGSTYFGQPCGSLGQIGILSFNGNKIITTSGGGALLTNEESVAQNTLLLSTQARDPAPHYEHSRLGFNYRLSNVCAGIGVGQMEVLNDRVATRRAIFDRYKAYFQSLNQQGLHIEMQEGLDGMFSNRWLTCMVIRPEKNNGLTREDVRLGLDKLDIESRPLWKPMHMQPFFQGTAYYGGTVAQQLFENGLCLPSGSNLTEDDFDRIFSALDTILAKK